MSILLTVHAGQVLELHINLMSNIFRSMMIKILPRHLFHYDRGDDAYTVHFCSFLSAMILSFNHFFLVFALQWIFFAAFSTLPLIFLIFDTVCLFWHEKVTTSIGKFEYLRIRPIFDYKEKTSKQLTICGRHAKYYTNLSKV